VHNTSMIVFNSRYFGFKEIKTSKLVQPLQTLVSVKLKNELAY